jgi:hypothetical protein
MGAWHWQRQGRHLWREDVVKGFWAAQERDRDLSLHVLSVVEDRRICNHSELQSATRRVKVSVEQRFG